jgi:hypothetical protein
MAPRTTHRVSRIARYRDIHPIWGVQIARYRDIGHIEVSETWYPAMPVMG